MKWPFGGEEEEEPKAEKLPEGELCDECGERRAMWETVEGNTKLCNLCQVDNKSHLVRIRSSLEEGE